MMGEEDTKNIYIMQSLYVMWYVFCVYFIWREEDNIRTHSKAR